MRSQAPRQEGSKILRSKQIRNGRKVPGEWHVQSARCQGDRRRVARARWGQQRAQGGAQEEQVKQWPQSDVTGQDRSARPSRLARDLICFCVSCTPSCRPVLARPRCLSTPPRTPPPRRALRCRPCATPSRYISPSARTRTPPPQTHTPPPRPPTRTATLASPAGAPPSPRPGPAPHR